MATLSSPDTERENTMADKRRSDSNVLDANAPKPLSGQQKMLAYLWPQLKLIVPGLLAGLVVGSISIYLGKIIGDLAQHVTSLTIPILAHASVILVGCYAVRSVLTYVQSVTFAEASQRITLNLRSDIYRRLNKLSLSFFDGEQTGNLISTISNDVPVLSGGIISLKDTITHPFVVIGSVAILFYLSPKLTLLTMFSLPLIFLILNQLSKVLRDISVETQNRLGDVTTTSEETLGASRLVRAFVAEDRETNRFVDQLEQAKYWAMKGVRRSALLTPIGDVVGAVSIAAAIMVGGNEVVQGHLPIGHLVWFVALLSRVSVSISEYRAS